uniref:Secreted protein n=1 Tax=Monopterus albus TaxID=43700 RepID=A0A3Q3IZP0_MONAL
MSHVRHCVPLFLLLPVICAGPGPWPGRGHVTRLFGSTWKLKHMVLSVSTLYPVMLIYSVHVTSMSCPCCKGDPSSVTKGSWPKVCGQINQSHFIHHKLCNSLSFAAFLVVLFTSN